MNNPHHLPAPHQLGPRVRSISDSMNWDTPTESLFDDRTELSAIPDTKPDREAEVAAVCKVLSVLERQLHDVSSDVETSVVGVCQGFQGMAQQAQAAVDAAQSAIKGNVEDQTGKDLIGEMREVLGSLVTNVQSSCQFGQTVSSRLSILESRLSAIQKSLNNVDEIAEMAKFVALNGQIEVARLGEAGLAISVVARETKTLATQAAQTSDAIRGLVNQLAVELNDTTAEMKMRMESDTKRSIESELLARSLLDDIQNRHEKITESLGATSRISSELRSDIARAVLSMQFQDRVNQRIAHVTDSLQLIVDRVHPNVSVETNDGVGVEWLSEIAKTYTMDAERIALGGSNADSSQAAYATSEESSVELF